MYDLAIVGGGLVGASFAHAISGHGLTVALLDKQPADALYSPQLDNRGLALSHISLQILQGLGLWTQLSDHVHPIKTVHVSEQGSFGFTRLEAERINLDALGYVISASRLGQTLIQGVSELKDVTSLRPTTIKGLCYEAEPEPCWTIALPEKKIRAKLLIAADGTHSYLRKTQNIPFQSMDYQQSALVTNICIRQSHQQVAFERFTADGTLALLPFGGQRMKCVWSAENAVIEQGMALNDAEFIAKIQSMLGFRLGRLQGVEKRLSFPIQQVKAEALYGQAMVLLGNAANTLHPVAAQGFNLGLRDVATLAEIKTLCCYWV